MAGIEAAIRQMAGVKGDVRSRMADAVEAIISASWLYREPGFSFADHPELEAEVNKILADLSDGILSDAQKRTAKALAEMELDDYLGEALQYAEGETGGETPLFRLDRHGDHLKELLAGWLIVSSLYALSQKEVRDRFWAFLGDPFASKEWRDAGLPAPGWGRGFQRNILNGFVLIGQDAINRGAQYATLRRLADGGARYYRTVRNSSYNCPFCDDMTKRIWPIDTVVLPYHPRCVCSAVPVYGDPYARPETE